MHEQIVEGTISRKKAKDCMFLWVKENKEMDDAENLRCNHNPQEIIVLFWTELKKNVQGQKIRW